MSVYTVETINNRPDKYIHGVKMKRNIIFFLFLAFLAAACGNTNMKEKTADNKMPVRGTETAVFAGGCYWCMSAPFERIDGISDVISGYSTGDLKGGGSTGKVESVEVIYDPKVISYSELLDVYWKQFDPTDEGGSFYDRGPQYETYIFYKNDYQKKLADQSKENLDHSGIFNKPIVTKVVKFESFSPVRESEQHFDKKNPARYYSYRQASGRDAFIVGVWGDVGIDKYEKPSKEELKKKLTPLQYSVTQNGDTERPFQNEYYDNHKEGIYVDIVTGEPLFSSTDKFDSGTGWPSFTKPIDTRYISKNIDRSMFEERVEVRSKFGNSHLGHVFDDGPAPTHLRYCINSAALKFIPKDKMKEMGYGEFMWIFDKQSS